MPVQLRHSSLAVWRRLPRLSSALRRKVARRLPLAVGGCLVAAGVVAGLGSGRGNVLTLHPSALTPASSPAAPLVPVRPRPGQATAGSITPVTPPPQVRRSTRRITRFAVPMVLDTQGVPAVALAAYERAAVILASADSTCHLTWEDLAGIGRVESDNGLTWGSLARVTSDGTLVPPILGPALDGRDGFPAIATTDGGVLEQDAHWARAVGPMQFLPSTWLSYARRAVGHGAANPQNFYDAALTAGVYLCSNGGDLASPSGLRSAIYAYNHSASYVTLVEAWITYYEAEGAPAMLAAGSGLLPVGAPSAAPTAPRDHRARPGSPGTSARSARGAQTAARPKGSTTTTTSTTPRSTSTTTSTTTTTTTPPTTTLPGITGTTLPWPL